MNVEELANELFEKTYAYLTDSEVKKIKNAYLFAARAHDGQLRKSGEPYIMHPIRTAQILTGLRADSDLIQAALMHDVPEDTKVGLDLVEKKFDKKIAHLVDGITKLSKVHYREKMDQRHIESLRKLLIYSAEDLRVVLIKIADRLDNMRTLSFIVDEKKRFRIAKETLEIYIPMANLLGIGEIRLELEDLCFEHLFPAEFKKLKQEVEENIEERTFILDEMIRLTEKELSKDEIEAEIKGRPKSLYSIYRKLQFKQTNIYNIDDIIAIRVTVSTRKDCYNALGTIHHLFTPKKNRVKDYIAVPKPNGYQSLHTTVFGLNGNVAEFQIRTKYMHLEAEYGIAAHYFYKYSGEIEKQKLTNHQQSPWVQRILEIQKEQKNPYDFLENLKLDVFQDRIFVFSPKGDVIDLPRDASVIDFAYAIHTDIGNHSFSSEINGIPQSITHSLRTGDTINIMTDKNIKPEPEWLNFVKTAHALNKIKEYLKNLPTDKKIEIGTKFMQKEFTRIGKNFTEELTSKKINLISEKFGYKNIDEILLNVGEGEILPQKIIGILYNHELPKLNILTKNKGQTSLSYVNLRIIGNNKKNQFREITRTLNALNVPIIKFIIDKPWHSNKDRCIIDILVKNYNELSQIFESLERLNGIEKISRRYIGQKIWFWICSVFTLAIWLIHPVILKIASANESYPQTISDIIILTGITLLFLLVFYLKNIAKRSFPELEETKYYWLFLYGVNTLALITIINEIFIFRIHMNWIFMLTLIVCVYAVLTINYIKASFRKMPGKL